MYVDLKRRVNFYIKRTMQSATEDMSSEVEQTMIRLGKKNGVKLVAAINNEGVVIKIQSHSDLDEAIVKQLSDLAVKLTTSTRANIKEFDASERACFVRVRMKDWEIVIVPDEKYTLIVVQVPTSDNV